MPKTMKHSASDVPAMVRDIKAHMEAIAKHRDELGHIAADLDDVLESTSEGLLALENAVDCLSQYQ